jgi:hypothetical protein
MKIDRKSHLRKIKFYSDLFNNNRIVRNRIQEKPDLITDSQLHFQYDVVVCDMEEAVRFVLCSRRNLER